MRRFVAILQAVSLLVAPLFCTPHVHAGATAQHSGRPHVHLHSQGAAGHRHPGQTGHRHSPHPSSLIGNRESGDRLPTFRVLPAAHDDDAIYLVTASVSAVRCAPPGDSAGHVAAPMLAVAIDDGPRAVRTSMGDNLLRPPNGACPVYLRTLRLRC